MPAAGQPSSSSEHEAADRSLQLVRSLTNSVTLLERSGLSPKKRSAAITDLARLIETAYGDDAAMIGDFMRECGGVELLIEYLEDESSDVQQRALMVLGNLVSDAVDPQSHLTKQIFVQTPAASDALLPLLEAPDWVTQMYL
jgi:HEAT repeat protein